MDYLGGGESDPDILQEELDVLNIVLWGSLKQYQNLWIEDKHGSYQLSLTLHEKNENQLDSTDISKIAVNKSKTSSWEIHININHKYKKEKLASS